MEASPRPAGQAAGRGVRAPLRLPALHLEGRPLCAKCSQDLQQQCRGPWRAPGLAGSWTGQEETRASLLLSEAPRVSHTRAPSQVNISILSISSGRHAPKRQIYSTFFNTSQHVKYFIDAVSRTRTPLLYTEWFTHISPPSPGADLCTSPFQ